MSNKVNLMSVGTTSMANSAKASVKTSTQSSDFSQSLDKAQQARSKDVKPEDKAQSAEKDTPKANEAEDAKVTKDGKEDVKAEESAKAEDAEKPADKAEASKEDAKAEQPNGENTDEAAGNANKASELMAAAMTQDMPMAELNTYFKGDARLQMAAQNQPVQVMQQNALTANQSTEQTVDSNMAKALQEMTPVADGEGDALLAKVQTATEQTKGQYAPSSIEALLGAKNAQAGAQNTAAANAQTGGQQMLELLAGQRVYTAPVQADTVTQKADGNVAITQLNDLVGNVELVQNPAQRELANNNSFGGNQNQQGALTNSQGQQMANQLMGEAAFDVVLPSDMQNTQSSTDMGANQNINGMAGLQNSDMLTNGLQNTQSTQQAPRNAETYNVPQQIVEQAKLLQKGENSEMLIKLNPEHLGQLSLKVSVNGNGGVTATFHTDNAQVRAIIETTMVQLKQQLNEQGIKVDNVEVQTGLPDGQLPQNQGQQGGYQQQGEQVRSQQADLQDFEETSEALAAEPVNTSEDVLHDSEGNQISRGVDYSV